jgi:hypothetical protein
VKKRMVYLPGPERWVSLGCYVRGIKCAKANLDAEFPHSLTGWTPATGRKIMRQFLAGVNDRINQGIPYSRRGVVDTP